MAKETILIIEDEKDIKEIIEYNLNKEGYKTITASSGEEGLKVLTKTIPDLIILDLMLPGIDGFEVCQIVRLNPEWQSTKIIFLTARGRELDLAKGLALGADAYITKPFSNSEVVASVRELLEGSE